MGLGTAEAFAILAGAGITNTGSTTVVGDIGTHPTPAQTGFGPGADSVTQTGTNHGDDAVTASAKVALVAAYDDAANRTPATPIPSGELGGLTLVPGVYADDNQPDSLAITGTLVLDGLNDTGSLFIFQSGSTLTLATGSNVMLINGAQECNVFWQVTSSATLNAASHLEGTILALTSISLLNGASIDGRALARNGAVTMDANTIRNVPCSTPPPPPTNSTPNSTTSSTSTSSTPAPSSNTTSSTTIGTGTSSTTSNSTTSTGTETTPIPNFPSFASLMLAGVAALVGANFLLRRRL